MYPNDTLTSELEKVILLRIENCFAQTFQTLKQQHGNLKWTMEGRERVTRQKVQHEVWMNLDSLVTTATARAQLNVGDLLTAGCHDIIG